MPQITLEQTIKAAQELTGQLQSAIDSARGGNSTKLFVTLARFEALHQLAGSTLGVGSRAEVEADVKKLGQGGTVFHRYMILSHYTFAGPDELQRTVLSTRNLEAVDPSAVISNWNTEGLAKLEIIPFPFFG